MRRNHRHLYPMRPVRKLRHRNLGGADRDRTGGLLVANQALSQLSYSPLTKSLVFGRLSLARTCERQSTSDQRLILVGLGRVELPTSPLSGVRSSHLSYRPGLPPRHPAVQVYKLEASGCELRTNQNICLLVARSPELAARFIFRGKG
jgi:hypothetical protein